MEISALGMVGFGEFVVIGSRVESGVRDKGEMGFGDWLKGCLENNLRSGICDGRCIFSGVQSWNFAEHEP